MSALKVCPQCSNEYPLDQRFCPLDGSTLKTQGAADDLVGSVVADRYYVLRKLGEGGMGQVYLAEHVRMGRKSALKVMHPGMVHDADAISRFNREAANASRISHPNVAAIYDFGETGDGLIYLAMEFVEGEALTAIVERGGALAPMRAADIVRQTADALAAAHDMGIVHRDLKPDNIMITKNRDGSDCVKVVDFGIAKSNEGSQKVTKTGLVVGTPEYMSPEQLAGDKLDGRSDIYSLGLVAFNVLTGTLPFPSESAQESMIMRLTDKPKRLGEMASHVAWPAELQAVMDRALERDAKLRYASASEFGRDFHRVIEAMPETVAAAAGTMVLDATAVIPKTRVDAAAPTAQMHAHAAPPAAAPAASAAAAPVATAEKKSKAPVLIGAGVLTAIAAGVVFALSSGGGDAKPAADSPAVQVAATTPDTQAAAAPQGAPAPPVERFSQETKPPAKAAEPEPRQPAASNAAAVDVNAELQRLLRLAGSEATAMQAVKGLDELSDARRIARGSEDYIYAQYIRGKAELQLGNLDNGCAILRRIQDASDRQTRNEMIANLVAACP